jgi:type II secretory pathway pseudopilin PulG
MKQKMRRISPAFTRSELLVVIVVVLVVAVFTLPHFSRATATAKSPRIACINNLKEIGTTYRLWQGETLSSRNSISWEKVTAPQSLALPGWD